MPPAEGSVEATAEKLRKIGVETLGIVGSVVERVRFYMRFRPIRCALGADPELATHRAYGVPRAPMTTQVWTAIETSSRAAARDLGIQVAGWSAHEAIARLDRFDVTDSEQREMGRHQLQFTGQFLLDRDGIVRWSNIECASEGLAGIDRFPNDEELLATVTALLN